MDDRRLSPYDPGMRTVTGLVLVVTFVFALAAGPATPATAPSCALWAAPFGDDTQPGTRAKPFATIGKLAASVPPGKTGCLEPGTVFETHGLINAAGTAGSPIRITSGPGARAILNDGLEFAQTAKYVTVDNIVVESRKDTVERQTASPTVIIRGFSIKLARSDVRGGNVIDVARSCILARPRSPGGHRSEHDPRMQHLHRRLHQSLYVGITVSIAVATTITNNTIWGNAGDAIALAPNSQVSTIRRNLIVDSGAGIYFSGGPKVASRDNVVRNNVITQSKRYAVHGSYQANAPTGRGNVVTRNCIWDTHIVAGQGFVAPANRRVNPRVVTSKTSGYRVLASSPCKAYAPAA